ncbi:MAG TPA: tRNA (adenosine(37)-N6)-threonylcarbamoyltransferase complex ATPase subunit type 1 TsaE [candidate division CPR3 bacterium]|uniref:tRNA threonylcarbamoyladenosine biosynthesis protein TsaE n=1 Tax=candidate division CPR3 bacterium TaxID=2268181 RepID=A0A7C1P5L8_UNCC3|nr:tRNA (adenosine(37)-N6)-threonylcarbamoyltransferase complex ATPase subunit type 1 TsaE [candidate division CPR3 bacterium]
MKRQTTSARQTKKLGEEMAKDILALPETNNAIVLALKGELGSGKTTFVQGLAKGLGVQGRVLSPTFLVVKEFELPHTNKTMLYHIDCYRLESSQELLDLGFKSIVANPKNIVVIEWADRVKKILSKDTKWIHFFVTGENSRELDVI